MRRLQDQMLRIRQHLRLALRRRSPQDEYDRTVLSVTRRDRRIRELFPSDPPMRIRLVRPHRKYRIQHQNPLLRPLCKTPMIRDPTPQVVMQLLIDIDQGGRNLHTLLHGEA